MKPQKVLFIDRDGTILLEPPFDYQVDSIEKFCFFPKVISSLKKISAETDYDLVLVSNQDGLGTKSFPAKAFEPYQNLMLDVLRSEGIEFSQIHIDPSLPEDNSPNRKPGTGMLEAYFDERQYDLKNSFVIGDRETDIQLAKNLGAQAIRISEKIGVSFKEKYPLLKLETNNWEAVVDFLLRSHQRTSSVNRKTKETEIEIDINLDGQGKSQIRTGISFFDHMLEQISKHGSIDLKINVKGDLEVDEHHTIEDTALALGTAFREALGNKKGINRYGFLLPMDDCLAQVAIDFSGRPWLVWDAPFKREKVGDFPTEMFFHFFKSFSDTSQCNLNIKAEGTNEHHKIEAIFKAFARATKMAIAKDKTNSGTIPSTKGML